MKKILIIGVILLFSQVCFGAQYCIQIIDATGVLKKSYTVTEKCPIREKVLEGRTQIILENKADFDEIERVYSKDGWDANYSYDSEKREISISAVNVEDNSKIIAPIQAEI